MDVSLKSCAWERDGDALFVLHDPGQRVEMYDPDGHAERLLTALASGPHTWASLREAVAGLGVDATVTEIRAAVQALSEVAVVVRPDPRRAESDYAERYFTNLAFFDLFSSLETTAPEYQDRLARARVLQLGVGGLGSNSTMGLAGLGVGHLTLLDDDVVELRNFSRQFLYRQTDIGRSKVHRAAEWVRAFQPDIDVTAVQRRVNGPGDVADLLDGIDLVVSGIDQPAAVDLWVNEACMNAGVPWVRGGMTGSTLVYFSVDPGRSACFACRERTRTVDLATEGRPGVDARLCARLERINPGVGPAAKLVGSLVAFEALRYLTRYQPPYAAGAEVVVDLRAGCTSRREAWQQDPDCALCRKAAAAVRDAQPVP
jgi:molybdopterin-synthase adenylyltransferase